jgi:DNA ligase-1
MFKPMLACTISDLTKIKFPVYASPKIDGIRCLILNGQVLSRSLKPIPNLFIQKELEGFDKDIDGELYIEGKTCNEISSAVMSEQGEPDFQYLVFDEISDKKYYERVSRGFYPKRVKLVERVYITDLEKLLEYEKDCLAKGYEGVMVRDPHGPYKNGRSTELEGYLMKIKRFEDSEAIVLKVIPEFENKNLAKVNELGYNKRSSHKANKVPKEMAGALIAKDITTGIEVRISAGLDHSLKKSIWENQGDIIGKIVKYKFMPSLKSKPRHPSFLGFRDERDMSNE